MRKYWGSKRPRPVSFSSSSSKGYKHYRAPLLYGQQGPSMQTKVISRFIQQQSVKLSPTTAASLLTCVDDVSAAAGACLNGCVQGTALNERIAKKIVMTGIYLKLRGHFHDPIETALIRPTTVRVVLFLARQNNRVAITTGDNLFLEGPDTYNEVFAFRDMNFTDSYKILVDKQINIAQTTMPYWNETPANAVRFVADRQWACNIKLPKLHIPVSYILPTGITGANIESNALYCLVYSGQDWTTGDRTSQVNGVCRVHFKG